MVDFSGKHIDWSQLVAYCTVTSQGTAAFQIIWRQIFLASLYSTLFFYDLLLQLLTFGKHMDSHNCGYINVLNIETYKMYIELYNLAGSYWLLLCFFVLLLLLLWHNWCSRENLLHWCCLLWHSVTQLMQLRFSPPFGVVCCDTVWHNWCSCGNLLHWCCLLWQCCDTIGATESVSVWLTAGKREEVDF